MNKWALMLAVVFLVMAKPSSAFVFEPQIHHCAVTDTTRWFGQPGRDCGTTFIQGSQVAYAFDITSGILAHSTEGWVGFNNIKDEPIRSGGTNLVFYKGSRHQHIFGTIPSFERVFEKSFSFPVPSHQDVAGEWRGVHDLKLDMQPGTYWVSFEDGVKGTYVSGPQGLKLAAIHNPEPASLVLMGGGLLGLLSRRRKRKSNRIEP